MSGSRRDTVRTRRRRRSSAGSTAYRHASRNGRRPRRATIRRCRGSGGTAPSNGRYCAPPSIRKFLYTTRLPPGASARIERNAPYERSRTLISVPNTSKDSSLGDSDRGMGGPSYCNRSQDRAIERAEQRHFLRFSVSRDQGRRELMATGMRQRFSGVPSLRQKHRNHVKINFA